MVLKFYFTTEFRDLLAGRESNFQGIFVRIPVSSLSLHLLLAHPLTFTSMLVLGERWPSLVVLQQPIASSVLN